MPDGKQSARTSLKRYAQENKREVVDLALRLLGRPSQNPPGDTRGIAGEVVALLAGPNIDVQIHPSASEIHNVVARVRGNDEGSRLILNGHLDTFPLGCRRALLSGRYDNLGKLRLSNHEETCIG